jgi:hypothetical protein
MMHAQKTGYSFVEVLVAIAILLVGIVGPLTIASKGLKNATFAREQNIAFFLAQEGIEGVIYQREKAGLEHLADESAPTWDWVPPTCRTGDACGVDMETKTINGCGSLSNCQLFLHDTGTIRYDHHAAGGTKTLYVRTLYFTLLDSDTVEVRSVVTWNASAYGSDRSVELTTYLYDIYGN